jgi:L-ascorbate metabolism protein UlaG (beta-lactamase superfamily)
MGVSFGQERGDGQDGGAERLPSRVRFLGHATVLIDLGYVRILTDPLLRHRISGLVWRHPSPRTELDHAVDAVLISHMHQDHLDLASLRRLGRSVPLLVPGRAGTFLTRRGFDNVHEMRSGQAMAVSESAATGGPEGIHETARPGEARVIATRALHKGFRPPFGPNGGCLGFVVEGGGEGGGGGGARVYFAGDTDIFPEMASLGRIDVALLPVAGWGPTLGPGHMDARRAAEALRLIRPRIAIPIHWGTYAPFGMHFLPLRYLIRPPHDFYEHAQELAPEVDVRILEPGEALDLDEALGAPAAGLEPLDLPAEMTDQASAALEQQSGSDGAP